MNKDYKISITLVCVLLGMLLVAQFRVTQTIKGDSISYQRIEDLSERLNKAEKERDFLKVELQKVKSKGTDEVLSREINKLKLQANLVGVSGQGVTVVLDDSKVIKKPLENPNLYLIHDDDLLKIINELRAAGAEALSLNDERIVATSEIRCAGPTVSVNNTRSAPPYVIKAIGNPKTLEASLKMRGGVVDTLKFWGIQAEIKAEENIVVPAYKGAFRFEYAKAVKQGENK